MRRDAGAEFSFATLLHPLPPRAFGVFMRVCSVVPHTLSQAFLMVALRDDCNVEVDANTVANVLWKLRTYLPSALGEHFPLDDPRLKVLQAQAAEANTLDEAPLHATCPVCSEHLTQCNPKDRGNIAYNIKKGVGYASTICYRYRIYTLHAGVQLASFREAQCKHCRIYFAGGWRYKKNATKNGKRRARSNYGKISDASFISDVSQVGYTLVMKEKAWYAVELAHSGGTFESAVIVWSKMHPEAAQRALILGADMTRLRNTCQAVADAWYIYHTVRLAGPPGCDIRWAFTTDGMESALQQARPLLRASHLRKMQKHTQECPRCTGNFRVLMDGKHGARRFVCCGVEVYETVDEFGVDVYTGCQRNAPAGHYMCKSSRPSNDGEARHLIPQEKFLGLEMPDGSGPTSSLKYRVRCFDPDRPSERFDVGLPRTEVRPDLLKEFEESLLPRSSDHGNQKATPAWLKGHRQLAGGEENRRRHAERLRRRGVGVLFQGHVATALQDSKLLRRAASSLRLHQQALGGWP